MPSSPMYLIQLTSESVPRGQYSVIIEGNGSANGNTPRSVQVPSNGRMFGC